MSLWYCPTVFGVNSNMCVSMENSEVVVKFTLLTVSNCKIQVLETPSEFMYTPRRLQWASSPLPPLGLLTCYCWKGTWYNQPQVPLTSAGIEWGAMGSLHPSQCIKVMFIKIDDLAFGYLLMTSKGNSSDMFPKVGCNGILHLGTDQKTLRCFSFSVPLVAGWCWQLCRETSHCDVISMLIIHWNRHKEIQQQPNVRYCVSRFITIRHTETKPWTSSAHFIFKRRSTKSQVLWRMHPDCKMGHSL